VSGFRDLSPTLFTINFPPVPSGSVPNTSPLFPPILPSYFLSHCHPCLLPFHSRASNLLHFPHQSLSNRFIFGLHYDGGDTRYRISFRIMRRKQRLGWGSSQNIMNFISKRILCGVGCFRFLCPFLLSFVMG